MTLDELAHIAQANGLELSDHQKSQLAQYAALLREKNQVVNLISRRDEENILEKHILHSLAIAMPGFAGSTFAAAVTVFDIGTGGGMPGIPLKIVCPQITLVLCDSIAKKMTAVNEFIHALGLKDTTAIIGRAEELARKPQHRKRYNVIISRAVAPLDELVEWSSELAASGAVLVALKGGDIEKELVRTRNMANVREAGEQLLILEGYSGFASDEKKFVRVVLG